MIGRAEPNARTRFLKEEDKMKQVALSLILSLLALLLLGCGSPSTEGEAPPAVEEPAGSDEFPARDANTPLAIGEKGTIILGNAQGANLQVQREDGALLYELPIKQNTVVDPDTAFTIQALETELPEELTEQYVAVGNTALELHVVNETGYGFALKPELKIHYSQEELAAAQTQGATLDPLKGNLIVLYKEQRSPRWAAMTTVTINEDARTVVVSNIAGAGAWRLVARK
jgi:hypothetical protein